MKTKRTEITVRDGDGKVLYYDARYPAEQKIQIPIGKIMQLQLKDKKVKVCDLQVSVKKAQ